MQTQFESIQQLAGQYHTYAEDSAQLYPYLEQLDQAILKNFEEKYANSARGFQPINLLRLECIPNLLRGKAMNDEKSIAFLSLSILIACLNSFSTSIIFCDLLN